MFLPNTVENVLLKKMAFLTELQMADNEALKVCQGSTFRQKENMKHIVSRGLYVKNTCNTTRLTKIKKATFQGSCHEYFKITHENRFARARFGN